MASSPTIPRPVPVRPRYYRAVSLAPPNKLRAAVLFVLIFVTYVSPPRLNLWTVSIAKAQPKSVDLRLEDFVLGGIMTLWLVRPHFIRWKSPLKPLIFAYLGWSVVSTIFALSQGWVNPLRAAFFTAKEIEYFLFLAVGLLCVRNVQDLKGGIAALVAGALVQGSYAVFQLATGYYSGAYAVGLLGDINPHIAGLCGCLSLYLGIVLFNPAKPRQAALAVTCAGLGALAIVGSISRTAIFSAGGGAFALLLLEMPQRRGILPRWAPVGLFVVAGLAAVLAYFALSSGQAGQREATLVERRFNPLLASEGSLDEYRRSRVDVVYEGYRDLLTASPILGNGKSITGHSDERFAEAHNHYLRLVVEAGFVGLFLYLAMIAFVLRTAFRLYRNGHPPLVRSTGLLCLLFTIVLLVAAMAQDVFVIPRIAQLYWIIVGMVMSLERIGLFQERRPIPLVA